MRAGWYIVSRFPAELDDQFPLGITRRLERAASSRPLKRIVRRAWCAGVDHGRGVGTAPSCLSAERLSTMPRCLRTLPSRIWRITISSNAARFPVAGRGPHWLVVFPRSSNGSLRDRLRQSAREPPRGSQGTLSKLLRPWRGHPRVPREGRRTGDSRPRNPERKTRRCDRGRGHSR